ncbi:MAG TPA: TetR/AcrR family transcriptional regulator [Acidimicrobiales bacterium]|nr:TetR/AcrR family transcriptional regulator [Acidimicrobiales bacterium]
MVNETSDRPGLTAKGARTRARIVEAAAALIHERGVAGATLEDVRAAAGVSGSQMTHYFADKNDLVQAVIDYQADAIVNRQRHALSGANGVEAWRNMVITAAKRTQAKGGCQLGSLVGQLAESDPQARALIAAGFDQWAAAVSDGLRSLYADRRLPSDIDPGDLAITLLATLEGGILLAQVHRSSQPIETAVNTLLALIIGN